MNIGCYFSQKLNALIHITQDRKVIVMVDEKVIPMLSFFVDGKEVQWIEPRRSLKDELEGVISKTNSDVKFTGWIAKYGQVEESFEYLS
ncbi:MAG: hypothetical protein K9H64_11370 [Bacteroidales bacterium]|nr:hypothetical protein [Bacteroidales bacterium]MCF8456551.1 hypothetical protein [Bacteroidales bacterium]